MKEVLNRIAEDQNIELSKSTRLTGGDINDVFKLATADGDYAVKINDAAKFPHMFQREAEALDKMRATNSFRIPRVQGRGEVNGRSYLLLEFLSSGKKQTNFWPDFGEKLAKMHGQTADYFGLDHDNYIAELPQYNKSQLIDAAEFYITYRLEPQFKIARDKGFSFPQLDGFFKNLMNEIPREKPALIHGDLWGGNYMTGPQGSPVLIDPALAYAPREMDIGMMNLFGGFPAEVFDCYSSRFPLEDNWQNRLDIWQLYYLLVHLNLFGEMYHGSVQRIHQAYL